MTSAALSEPPAHAGLTDVLETLDDALIVTDLALDILQWNAAMERLSGLPRASAVGRNANRLLPLFDVVGLPQHLRRAIGGEVRFTAEVPGSTVAPVLLTFAATVPLPLRMPACRVMPEASASVAPDATEVVPAVWT